MGASKHETRWGWRRRGWSGLVILIGGLGTTAASAAPAPFNVVGQVEIAPGVPAANHRVQVEGVPLGAVTGSDGSFRIRGVPVGARTLRICAPTHGRSER